MTDTWANERILVTGAAGFIGSRVVHVLLEQGFSNIRCIVRHGSSMDRLDAVLRSAPATTVEILRGNLLSRDDCAAAVREVTVVYHLAAGIDKSYAAAFMNSVISTRNLLDALIGQGQLKRFVNVSSLAVYSNRALRRGDPLDETCAIEQPPSGRREAYTYAKIKQDQLLLRYAHAHKLPYVIVRPGSVYGPGKQGLTGRVGVSTFGLFLHVGGSIRLPLSYVDNCAEAIVSAGITPGAEGEVFNIVDDNPLRSRDLLRLYKRHVKWFPSVRLPYATAYFLCLLWESYSKWSEGQLPPVFNRSRCVAEWKGNTYPNDKAKRVLGWRPRVSRDEALRRYVEYQRRAVEST